MSDLKQALADAVALTTNLLHEQDAGTDWTQTIALADEMVERSGSDVLMAHAYLMIQILRYASDLAAQASDADVPLDGIPHGTSPEDLLREFGRQVAEAEDEGI